MLESDEPDETLADNEADEYVKDEIFNKLVWTKSEAIQMLQQKGMTELVN